MRPTWVTWLVLLLTLTTGACANDGREPARHRDARPSASFAPEDFGPRLRQGAPDALRARMHLGQSKETGANVGFVMLAEDGCLPYGTTARDTADWYVDSAGRIGQLRVTPGDPRTVCDSRPRVVRRTTTTAPRVVHRPCSPIVTATGSGPCPGRTVCQTLLTAAARARRS